MQELITADTSTVSPSSWKGTSHQQSHPAKMAFRRAANRSHLCFLHLHDVGLTVGDAVVDVVDVGRQRVHFFVEGERRLLGLGALPSQTLLLPDHLLLAFGQLLSLLRVTQTNLTH